MFSLSSFRVRTVALLLTIPLAGCGFVPPALTEAWEARDVGTDMVLKIKRNIFCETIKAIRTVNTTPTDVEPPIPPDYGVQLQLTLTVVESSGLTPNLTYNRTLTNGSESGISIDRNWSAGVSGELSSTATRTGTTYSYWSVGGIAGPGKNDDLCNEKEWPIRRQFSSREIGFGNNAIFAG
jgi:hypothetical protein